MEHMPYVLLTDDQHFLLSIIMGAYFGPDLKGGIPPKSALQRHSEALQQYLANDLAGSQMKTTVMENVYYYVLRKAEQSVVVKQPLLLEYLHGIVPITLEGFATYLQFDDLFPPMLHVRSQCRYQHGTIDNIVLINNPDMNYMKPSDVERFKRLTGLENFCLDLESVVQHITVSNMALCSAKVLETSELNNTMQHGNAQHLDCLPGTETYTDVLSQMTASSEQNIEQGMMFLPSCPTEEEWSKLVATIKGGIALSGSAARGHLGPVLGLIDIGVSEDSYLFRVSLPGVRRDAKEFSCEVESDGTVIIKGVTVTGEGAVEKYSQVFEMRTHKLCPPGPFCISFKLPGPVDPQRFHGTFATDGILEGIALKGRRYTR